MINLIYKWHNIYRGEDIVEKKYYGERKGFHEKEPMDYHLMKRLFKSLYKQLEDDLFFSEAMGYDCVDLGKHAGLWGHDIGAYFYRKLKRTDIWPIMGYIDDYYDEVTLFTVIEFLYDYVSEATGKHYHEWNDCGWHTSEWDKESGQQRYRDEINELLKDYKDGYALTEDGEIIELAPSGMESLIDEKIVTEDPDNIDNRIKTAKRKYLRYGASLDDKKDAVRTLADVLEFLKKSNIRLLKKDESDLFQIINSFDIRHHNKSQQGDYDKEIWYDWLFYTFLASIYVLLKLESE